MSGLAAALGPVLGGVLVQASWRWVFIVNVPIGIAAIVAGRRVLPRPAAEGGPLPDLFGAVLLAAGIGAVTLGLVEANTWGWSSWRIIVVLVAAVAGLAIVLRRSSTHRSPILELSLLREPRYAIALAATALFSTAFGAMLLSIVLWLQEDWGWSALKSGLAVAPGPLMVPPIAILSARLLPRFGAGGVIALGCALFAGGVFWWETSIQVHPDYLGDAVGGMLLTGTGVGLALPTLFATAAAALPRGTLRDRVRGYQHVAADRLRRRRRGLRRRRRCTADRRGPARRLPARLARDRRNRARRSGRRARAQPAPARGGRRGRRSLSRVSTCFRRGSTVFSTGCPHVPHWGIAFFHRLVHNLWSSRDVRHR